MRISVNVLSWKQRKLTLGCLERLQDCVESSVCIRLIDNGSDDGTVEAARDAFPKLRIEALAENHGFAGGHNRGMRTAFGEGDDAVVLLNNDAVPEPGFLEPLERTARLHPSTGLMSPKIRVTHEPERIWYAGGEIDWWRGLAANRGGGELDGGRYDQGGATGYATGCALWVSRQAFERVGPMDESYFLYLEDVDWSVRARRAGFEVRYEPASLVYHGSGASSGGIQSDAVQYYFTRNRIRLLQRHGHWYHWATFAPFLARHTGAHAWRAWRQGPSGRARALWRGVADAARGRGGPFPYL